MLLLVFFGIWVSEAVAQSLNRAPCWIEDASAAGEQVWLLCDQQRAYVSSDAGATWRESKLPSMERLRTVEAVAENRAFVGGDQGTLLLTSDGGAQWSAVAIPAKQNLRDVHFVGDLGWIVGAGGTVLHSTDGGATWKTQASGTSQSLEAVYFADARNGWVAGWNGTMLRTVNGGAKWEVVQSPLLLWSLNSVYFRDPQNGWALGILGQVLRTNDGGLTWKAQEAPARNSFTSVIFDGAGRGWIASENTLLLSEDGGETWKPQPLEGWAFAERMLVVKDSIWVVGPFGALKRDEAGNAWKDLKTLKASR
ncbi:MAG: hypothetical protein HY820_05440 [Acidobacteria bacterium]|nr:hypothetical protein [Acidobacteriota bacterium]